MRAAAKDCYKLVGIVPEHSLVAVPYFRPEPDQNLKKQARIQPRIRKFI